MDRELVERIRKTLHDKIVFRFNEEDRPVSVLDTEEVEEWGLVFPELAEDRRLQIENGKPNCFLFDIIIIYKAKHVVHLKNGARSCHTSSCPFYSGYWILGGCGNVDCKSSASPVPGRVNELYCTKRHEDCPLYKIEKEVGNE